MRSGGELSRAPLMLRQAQDEDLMLSLSKYESVQLPNAAGYSSTT